MGYIYPIGVATGFSGLASFMVGRFSGITGTPSGVPQATGTDGFLQAMCDAVLAALEEQQSDAAALGAASTTNTSFEDVGNGSSTGFSTWTPTVSVSKKYKLLVDLSCYISVSGGGADRVYFQLLVDGAAPSGQPSNAMLHSFSAVNSRMRMSFVVPLFLSAGSHTFKLQWKVDTGVTAFVTTSADFRCFTLVG